MTIWISLAKSGLRERISCLPPSLKFGAAPSKPPLSCDHVCSVYFFLGMILHVVYFFVEEGLARIPKFWLDIPLCLSWIVRRVVGGVCVEHNYPKVWMD